jgi:hypothetical protein
LTRKFRELVHSGDTLHPEGEYALDVTKAGGSKALLSLKEGEGEMLRIAAKKVMWV